MPHPYIELTAHMPPGFDNKISHAAHMIAGLSLDASKNRDQSLEAGGFVIAEAPWGRYFVAEKNPKYPYPNETNSPLGPWLESLSKFDTQEWNPQEIQNLGKYIVVLLEMEELING